MWSPLHFVFMLTLAAVKNAWEPGYEYKYQIESRTLVSFEQLADEYFGVLGRANLTLLPQNSSSVLAWISDAKFSSVKAVLAEGWESQVPENEVIYESLPLLGKPFQIKFRNGTVDELVVSKDLSDTELNLIKRVVSLLQMETGKDEDIQRKLNRGRRFLEGQGDMAFITTEDTIIGECEVSYSMSTLPGDDVKGQPVGEPDILGDGQFYSIVKTKNFSNCNNRSTYPNRQTGFTDDSETGDNMSKGYISSPEVVSRMVISGDHTEHTIQSSVTDSKATLSPGLYNEQKGLVFSRMGVTLVSRVPSSGSPPSLADPRHVKDLHYDYSDPLSSGHRFFHKRRGGLRTKKLLVFLGAIANARGGTATGIADSRTHGAGLAKSGNNVTDALQAEDDSGHLSRKKREADCETEVLRNTRMGAAGAAVAAAGTATAGFIAGAAAGSIVPGIGTIIGGIIGAMAVGAAGGAAIGAASGAVGYCDI